MDRPVREVEEQCDKEKHYDQEEINNASITRVNTPGDETQREENEGSTPQKQKENNSDGHIKRLGQIIKDAAKIVKEISFKDLDEQKFELYKLAICLAGKYIE